MFANTGSQAGRKRHASEINRDQEPDQNGVRKRISRACDQCNLQRSKCDGTQPCAHCLQNSLICAYKRVHKKRGRAPKRDAYMAEEMQPVAQQAAFSNTYRHMPLDTAVERDESITAGELLAPTRFLPPGFPTDTQHAVTEQQPTFFNAFATSQPPIVDGLNSMSDLSGRFTSSSNTGLAMANSTAVGLESFEMQGYGFPLGDNCSVAFMGRAPMVESPDWLALTSPLYTGDQRPTPPRPPDSIRYPVLLPLLPHLHTILPQDLACDLLEQYFTSSISVCLWPRNPYILSYVFRKQSILHPVSPRPCSPALLASMLWISAQHSDAPLLTAQPDARAQTCQKLLELTMNMLQPLIHGYGPVTSNHLGRNGTSHSDTGLSGLLGASEVVGSRSSSKIQVDNLVTYIHLATVVSASERKAASLRWWNSAWSLAREVRLGRELPQDIAGPPDQNPTNPTLDYHNGINTANTTQTHPSITGPTINEEDREERRRTWWLLYMMDRHLALCYNRPMFFLNKECEGLYQPMDDSDWQAGTLLSTLDKERRRGLNIECTSISVFGYFLPLMVILGEILDLNHARNRPRFGPGVRKPKDFSETVDEIEVQLSTFEQSLDSLKNGSYGKGVPHQKSELVLQIQTVGAYSTHIMHVLHILLTGKWDPIALLDDNDLWISSQSFVNATGHAVSAAKALARIIEHDPDLSCMPFFFGIYLLQGSFLLLLFADKLQGGITSDVVEACETIVRAHEACVSTLDTQYQRNFRRVMRSALQQLRGRTHEDAAEQQNWRREILKLYRWTGDGTGLAL